MARLPTSTRDVKRPTSIRLSPEAQALIQKLRQNLGVSQSAVLELAIRRLAELENIR